MDDVGRQETHRRILESAARVFADNGYARSTTRAIAGAAKVTEVTLFRHFESKERLFSAVVERYGGKAVAADMEAQLTGDYRADLMRMGAAFVAIMLDRKDIVRMMLCEAAHFPDLARILSENPRTLREMLARYLRAQIELGRVRSIDPEAAAQAFWNMFFAYGVTAGTYAEPVADDEGREAAVERFVDIFVNGTASRE